VKAFQNKGLQWLEFTLVRGFESLDVKCGCPIAPDKIRRIDFRQVECPECGEHFIPEKRGKSSQCIMKGRPV
jgi:hypothetical protein